ncbi:Hypothetical predicted protein [Paramuricea clavata]|uniref:Uncharacterized protein n=1 Tax=Paramuricea clavata TaxID=317549 RepID=A0A6S7G4F8_PARCT|nr:Hypothetical predicted protein [Paramuricea clavata]
MSSKSQRSPLVGDFGNSGSRTNAFGDDEGIELEDVQIRKNEVDNEGSIGLSSDEAYRRLCSIIRHELTVFNHANNAGWWWDFVKMLGNSAVCINWISLALVVLQLLLVILGYLCQENR